MTDDASTSSDIPEEADDVAAIAPESKAVGSEDERRRALAPTPRLGLALLAGLMAVLALGGLAGWQGHQAFESRAVEQQRDVFLRVGREFAVALTTVDYERVDSDVQRVLDSATGAFLDDYRRRAPELGNAVRVARSTSVGTVMTSALESVGPNDAEVLIALSVKTVILGQPDQAPRPSRMRILIHEIDGDPKVSNVELVV